MAIYTMLQTGSRGNEVKKMQQALVDAGYSVGASGIDGIYGSDTEAAVRRYQQAKALQVDGIAGDETLGSLYGSGKTDPAPPVYDPSGDELYQRAMAALQQVGDAPEYPDRFDRELETLYAQIVNREPFRYDPGKDPLYRQYADSYITAGRLAMLDTMGETAALTGGYGSSYAQIAGQQQYGAYLQKLSGAMAELSGMALDRYEAEGEALEERYAMAFQRSEEEYRRYKEALAAWQKELAAKQAAVQEAYEQGYDRWREET